ncbi:MAG: hypothetical protein KID00_15550 [Clostridium argentinense]|uniref:Uncharacterized protein n=1 Tax=Clostridium faecium TaxID=2762223 RepID=A0ABR8YS20_9CLOT|nr:MULTISPECIES: hypothetical protein [Clostridium]MBD8047056.1 hypothetical protein [Clostridium faecium]MBS5825236.1 hypothetical protein [Clostridium argentinense]MDU1348220.1 hypothetical protein [Clostridium argentinense]
MKKLAIASVVMTVLLLNTNSVSASPCHCSHSDSCSPIDGNARVIKVPHDISYKDNGTIYHVTCDAYETHWYATYKCSKCGTTHTERGVTAVHPSKYCSKH